MLVANGAKVVIADLQDEPGQALARNWASATCIATSPRKPTASAPWPRARAGHAVRPGELRRRRPAAKIVGKNGAHPLDLFQKVVSINLIGSFNMMRLAAEAMSANAPSPPANAAS